METEQPFNSLKRPLSNQSEPKVNEELLCEYEGSSPVSSVAYWHGALTYWFLESRVDAGTSLIKLVATTGVVCEEKGMLK